MRGGQDLVVEVVYLLEILLPQIYQDLAVEHLGLRVEHQVQVAEHQDLAVDHQDLAVEHQDQVTEPITTRPFQYNLKVILFLYCTSLETQLCLKSKFHL